MRFELDVEIDRPVAQVFSYITDVRNVPAWQESAESADWVEPGKRFRERRTFMGRTAELELEVTVLEPNRRFDVRTVKAPVTFEIHHSFAEADGATQVHVVGEAKLGGALRLAAGMAKKQAERQFRTDFDRLKEILEDEDSTQAGA